jgi:hypothetical protein
VRGVTAELPKSRFAVALTDVRSWLKMGMKRGSSFGAGYFGRE